MASSGSLTPKQDKFVKAYLLNGGNATQAAISAGYSKKTAKESGYENLTKPHIAKVLKSHQEKANETFIYDKTKKLDILQSIINNAATMHDERGMINHSAAISAIKEHNLMQGDNEPIETNQNVRVMSETDW